MACTSAERRQCLTLGQPWRGALRIHGTDIDGDLTPWDPSGQTWRVHIRNESGDLLADISCTVEELTGALEGKVDVSWSVYETEALGLETAGRYRWGIGYTVPGSERREIIAGPLGVTIPTVRFPA